MDGKITIRKTAVRLETVYEGSSKPVGYLKAHAQQHREYEKQSHLVLSEQSESIKPEYLHPTFILATPLTCGTIGQGQGISAENNPPYGTEQKLERSSSKSMETIDERCIKPSVYYPHGDNKTYCTENPDRWKYFYSITMCLFNRSVTHRIGQC